MERQSSQGIADEAQIHPRMNWEELASATSGYMRSSELRALGMGLALLSKVFQLAMLYSN
jgi:hypothetical protein